MQIVSHVAAIEQVMTNPPLIKSYFSTAENISLYN